MEKIDISKLKRAPNIIKSKIEKKNNKLIAKEDLKIIFPQRFVDKGLTILDNICQIFGCVAIVDDKNNYAIMTVAGRLEVIPSEINNIEIDEELYVELEINKGDNLVENTKFVKNQDIAFTMFDLLIMQGKVPWYLEYEDMLKLFINLPKHTGSSVGEDPLPIETLLAISARDPKDLEVEYRNIIKDRKDLKKYPVTWVGMKNIYYSFKSTLAKIGGSYFKEGVIAAMVNPEKDITDIERTVRK